MVQPLPSHHTTELIDPPVNLPISLAEVKAQLRVEHSDDDALLTRLIGVAVAYTDVKGELGQAMITQKWGQWLSPFPPFEVKLILGHVIDVTAISYYDENGVFQSDNINNYEVFGINGSTTIKPKSGFSWPIAQRRPDAIRIDYQIGFGDTSADVPETIRHALMLLIAHWYENREQSQMDELKNIPFGFSELINMHRFNWYG